MYILTILHHAHRELYTSYNIIQYVRASLYALDFWQKDDSYISISSENYVPGMILG